MLWDNNTGIAYIGNTGDTRAVLSRGGYAVDITIDRKATDSDEIARMAQAGGHVNKGRVMGSLAVARAFGDAQLKKGRGLKKGKWSADTPQEKEVLIVDPDITSFRPKRLGNNETDDEFIVIATDGLWDVMTSQEAVNEVKKHLSSLKEEVSNKDLTRIGDLLASQAVNALMSQDNVTVMIITFHGHNSEIDDDGDLNQSDSETELDEISKSSFESKSASAKVRINEEKEDMLESLLDRDISPKHQHNVQKQHNSHDSSKLDSKVSSKDDDMMDFLLDDGNF
tara:strand:+ start:47 stop:892 length:846 start_codon:yes stop_codon:yes gene_type:complete